MATRDADDGQIQFKAMGGLNERPAPHALEAPQWAVLHALYQRNAGALQRLEGNETLALLPSGAGVLGGAQLDDGTGNNVVQGDNGTEYLYTLDELFGRTPVNTLVYEPLPDDLNMPTATLIQSASNGTDLADIGGSSANTMYTRPLTANPVNESSIIVAFVSGASASFEIAPGTYRINGYVTAAFTYTLAAGATLNNVSGGFQAAITDTTNSVTVAIGSPANVTLQRSTTASTGNAGPINVQSVFVNETFEITGTNAVLQVKNAFSTAGAPAGSVAISGGVAADVTATLNGAALTQPYVSLSISKIA